MWKTLIDPLLICEMLMAGGVLTLWRVVRGGTPVAIRRAVAFVSFALLLLIALSMPAVAYRLRCTLMIGPGGDEQFKPNYIVVLSGGYLPSVQPDLDILSTDTMSRTLAGIAYWRSHRNARLILTGALPRQTRANSRLTELMAEVAICHGVPSSAIILEPTATTTREHPLAILRLPGIGPDARIMIVTSAVHMRRAAIEFRKSFEHVACDPVHESEFESLDWTEWSPQIAALWQSKDAIHEWLGIAYYRMTSRARA
jgi:uncharacterized SAM-binding protein YcdF (DUF218 family)